MNKIKVCHLYYDLMNLYGENGNMIALIDGFKKQNVEVEIDNLTINDKIDFHKYDIFFMGMGSEDNQELVRKDILKYKKDLKDAIENNKTFILTGNSYELLGNSIEDKECLKIFNFESHYIKERISIEQVMETDLFEKKIIGYQNRGSVNNNKEYNFLKVINGNGNDEEYEYEGIHYKNLYATYTFGPLLIRNPYLLDYIIKNILKDKNIKYKENLNTSDYKAYDIFLENFNIK